MEVKHSRTLNISWKNTFNSSLKFHGDINKAFVAAQQNGYSYLEWNGWVYEVTSRGRDEDRIIVASELPT